MILFLFKFFIVLFKEKFCEMRDKINIYKEFSIFNTKCKSCGKTDHDLHSCNLLTY